ncbi:MAG: hypothetical protein LAP21_25670 [Acidobacteriia bacterium]|nr:hypothetical protein [Terriglobia bacterium]
MKRKLKGVKGKVVEAVAVCDLEGSKEVDISFGDKTALHIRFSPRLVLEAAELRDWKQGEGELLKKFV